MRLCFGTFATVLNCCRNIDVTQAVFVARIAMGVDPISRYIGDNRFDLDKEGEELKGDKSAATKLLSCQISFIFTNSYRPTLDSVIKNFQTQVSPFIDEDKKAKVVLAILDIIRRDKELDFDKKENFKKYLGVEKQELLKQCIFNFSDLLGRILLYTVCGNVDNKVGQEHVKSITNDYIDNVAKSFIYDYKWDSDNQRLILLSVPIYNIIDIFQQSISEYQIDDFIEKIDPTNRMHYEWVEKCDSFTEYMELNILALFKLDSTKESDPILMKIRQFDQTLDDYTKYLGPRMRPIAEFPDTLVPLFRDENPKWALEFEKETINYRSRLIRIYGDISKLHNTRESGDLKPVRKPKNNFNE